MNVLKNSWYRDKKSWLKFLRSNCAVTHQIIKHQTTCMLFLHHSIVLHVTKWIIYYDIRTEGGNSVLARGYKKKFEPCDWSDRLKYSKYVHNIWSIVSN